jgi:acetyl esterase/lipase
MSSKRHLSRNIGLGLLLVLVLAIIVGVVVYKHFQSDTPFSGSYNLQTVTYCSPNQNPQLMDIYTPKNVQQNTLMPVVEMVHGGGWTGGSRGPLNSIQPVPEIPDIMLGLLKQGFMVTSIDYRLAPKYPFPANIEDVKCSIRYLRAHASEYDIDSHHIGLMGSSSGGHLVSLAGLAGPSAGWDVGEYTDQSSVVQAVVDMFGPEYLNSGIGNAAMRDPSIFGSGPTALTKASPPTYISKVPNTDPPFLIIQGNKDQTVPPYHSVRFYQQLVAAGQPAMFHMIQNAGHELISIPSNAAISPSPTQITNGVISFLVNHLKESASTGLAPGHSSSFSSFQLGEIESIEVNERFRKPF